MLPGRAGRWAAAPGQNWERLWLAVGTVLAVACPPLADSDGFLDFGRLGMAA